MHGIVIALRWLQKMLNMPNLTFSVARFMYGAYFCIAIRLVASVTAFISVSAGFTL